MLTHRRPLVAGALALLALNSAAAAQQLGFEPYRANGVYEVGERVGWRITTPGGAAAGRYTYTVRRDGRALLDSGSFTLANGSAHIETALDRPGMLLIDVRPPAGTTGFGDRSTGGNGRVLLGAAVAPTQIAPAAPRPADFKEFWAGKLEQLRAVPVEPLLTRGESGKPDVDYYTVRLNNIRGAHVYGQLARPAAEGKYPALVILQWASPPYPLQKSWVTDRAAEGWLVLNVEPHDVPAAMPQAFYDALPQLIKNYQAIGQHSRDESYFLQMYLGDYRALEYLTSRPDWDGRTLVLTGTSMGGQQSLAVAGLFPGVTALVVNEPAGCDVAGPLHGRAPAYPNWDVSRPEVLETAPYFDPVNFAPDISALSMVSVGFIDVTATPAGIWAAYNLIPAPKEVVPMVDSPHNHMATPAQQQPWSTRSEAWLAAVRQGRNPLDGSQRR